MTTDRNADYNNIVNNLGVYSSYFSNYYPFGGGNVDINNQGPSNPNVPVVVVDPNTAIDLKRVDPVEYPADPR